MYANDKTYWVVTAELDRNDIMGIDVLVDGKAVVWRT